MKDHRGFPHPSVFRGQDQEIDPAPDLRPAIGGKADPGMLL
jgi:hypothetical protein